MPSAWRPFKLSWDDSPIDISFVFESERPAGKHGFLKVEGSKFVFRDGAPARFWGTCFNSGANFPPHSYSEIVARRLAKFGVNMVRTHQMDAEWATPNIFEFNRAKANSDTRSLDPQSMDRLDYLFHCLREQGIYIYLDMLTYRKFLPGDGVDAVDQIPWGHSAYAYFDPRHIELQKEFARNLWCHINPYTKLAYKDDPAIVLTEIQNEGHFFFPSMAVTVEPYRTRLEALYRAWADQHAVPLEPGKIDFTLHTVPMGQFFVDVMIAFNKDMIAYLRDIGVKVPITGTNHSRGMGILPANLVTDYSDSHVYWNFPRWESPEGTDTRPLVGEVDATFHRLSFLRALDKPFFVSEWDHAWPAPYRAESPVLYAAVGALQGWSGFTIHTYRYGTHHPVDCMGATTINGITYRKHFDSFNDPSKFGLFQHAALLFRRGDLKESQTSVAVQVTDDMALWPFKQPEDLPGLVGWSEKHRMGVATPGTDPKADQVVPANIPTPESPDGEVLSDTGELWRSWKKRYGWLDTPRSKAVYGFLGAVGRIELKGLALEVRTDFATIALSSLSNEPIEQADSLLLTAVGRSDNSDTKYDEQGIHLLDAGHAPTLIEPIEATVEIVTSRSNLKVWVIADNKEAVTRLPTEYRDGVLRFQIGAQPPHNPSTIYYLIRI